MTTLVSSRWLGEWGERLLCFSSWGIFENKMYMYLLFLVVITLASWYFVVLCIRCIVAVLTKVCTLAFKNNECEWLGNIHSRKVCTRFGVCLHLDLRLSPFLFATKSGV